MRLCVKYVQHNIRSAIGRATDKVRLHRKQILVIKATGINFVQNYVAVFNYLQLLKVN